MSCSIFNKVHTNLKLPLDISWGEVFLNQKVIFITYSFTLKWFRYDTFLAVQLIEEAGYKVEAKYLLYFPWPSVQIYVYAFRIFLKTNCFYFFIHHSWIGTYTQDGLVLCGVGSDFLTTIYEQINLKLQEFNVEFLIS